MLPGFDLATVRVFRDDGRLRQQASGYRARTAAHGNTAEPSPNLCKGVDEPDHTEGKISHVVWSKTFRLEPLGPNSSAKTSSRFFVMHSHGAAPNRDFNSPPYRAEGVEAVWFLEFEEHGNEGLPWRPSFRPAF